MKKIRGIIFDLDGVIVDTAKYHYLAWKKTANNLGFDISPEQNEFLKGVSRVKSLQKILKWGNIKVSKEEFEQLLIYKNKEYLANIAYLTQEDILPGVIEVLNYLIKNNIPFALASASKNARTILRNLDLEETFKVVVDGNEVNRAKPSSDIFISAAKKLGIPTEECAVFEDSQAGILAANKAGMMSIGIGDKEILKEADYNFTNFREIDLKFLQKIIK